MHFCVSFNASSFSVGWFTFLRALATLAGRIRIFLHEQDACIFNVPVQQDVSFSCVVVQLQGQM